MGVLPQFGGIAVHDGWKPYKTYTGAVHALCNAHHLRELAGVAENAPADAPQGWAEDLAVLLVEVWDQIKAIRAVHEHATGFTVDALECIAARYEEIVAAGRALHPARAPGEPRRRRSKAANLLDRLDTERDQVLRFAFDWRVPFDNNRSEQAIRMAKVQLSSDGRPRTAAPGATRRRGRGRASHLVGVDRPGRRLAHHGRHRPLAQPLRPVNRSLLQSLPG